MATLPNTNLSWVQNGVVASGTNDPTTGNGVLNATAVQLLANDNYLLGVVINTPLPVNDLSPTLTAAFQTVYFSALTSARTITLNWTPVDGDIIVVADPNGVFATYNITIQHSSNTYKINGANTLVLSSNYAHTKLVFLGGSWVII